jgi:hypothetical protein
MRFSSISQADWSQHLSSDDSARAMSRRVVKCWPLPKSGIRGRVLIYRCSTELGTCSIAGLGLANSVSTEEDPSFLTSKSSDSLEHKLRRHASWRANEPPDEAARPGGRRVTSSSLWCLATALTRLITPLSDFYPERHASRALTVTGTRRQLKKVASKVWPSHTLTVVKETSSVRLS